MDGLCFWTDSWLWFVHPFAGTLAWRRLAVANNSHANTKALKNMIDARVDLVLGTGDEFKDSEKVELTLCAPEDLCAPMSTFYVLMHKYGSVVHFRKKRRKAK